LLLIIILFLQIKLKAIKWVLLIDTYLIVKNIIRINKKNIAINIYFIVESFYIIINTHFNVLTSIKDYDMNIDHQ